MDDDMWKDQSFELADLSINTRLPNMLEIDEVIIRRASRPKDIIITCIEKKSKSKKLGEDVIKLQSLASRYILRPFDTSFLVEKELPDERVILRGCLPEIELFLNLLIAIADYSTIKKLAEEVVLTLQKINNNTGNKQGNLLGEAIKLLCSKAQWLTGNSTAATKTLSSMLSLDSFATPTDPKNILAELGILPIGSPDYKTIIIAVGLMGIVQRESIATAIDFSLEKLLGQPSKILLICTDESKENAEFLKHRLPSINNPCTYPHDKFDEIVDSLETPLALILTDYRQGDTKYLLEIINEKISPLVDVYSVGVYSVSGKGKKTLRPMTTIKFVGTVSEFV